MLRKIAFYILFILVLFSPFVFNPFGIDCFRLPKEIFAKIFILFLLGISALEVLEKQLAPTHKRLIHKKHNLPLWLQKKAKMVFILPAFLVFASGISTIFSTSLPLSIEQLINIVFFLSIPYVIFFYFKNEDVVVFLRGFVIAAFLTSVYCVLQYFGKDPLFKSAVTLSSGWVVTSGFIDNPNLVGGYLAAVLPLCLAMFYTVGKKEKFLVFISLLVIFPSIVLTHAKTSLISSVVSIVVFFFCIKKYVWKKRLLHLVSSGILIFLSATFFAGYIAFNKGYTAKLQTMEREINIKTGIRALYWAAAGAMIEDRPITGCGIGTYKYNYIDYMAFLRHRIFSNFTKNNNIAVQAHNEFLQFGAETGLAGLSLLLVLLFYYFSMVSNVLKKEGRFISSKNINSDVYKKQVWLIGFLSSTSGLAVNSLANFPFHVVPSALVGVCVLGFSMLVCFGEFDVFSLFGCFRNLHKENFVCELKEKKRFWRIFLVKVCQVMIIALVSYFSVILYRPLLANTYLKTAEVLEKNRHLSMGISAIEKAISLEPTNGYMHYRLGVMHIKVLEFFLNNLFPVDKSLYTNKALVQFKLAEETFKIPPFYFYNAYSQELRGRKEDAYSWYSMALFYNPKDRTALRMRSALELKKKYKM